MGLWPVTHVFNGLDAHPVSYTHLDVYKRQVLDRGEIAADGPPKAVFSQVELLHRLGLSAPETVELCWQLRKAGPNEIFDEAENRLHAQKAVMYLLMKDQ